MLLNESLTITASFPPCRRSLIPLVKVKIPQGRSDGEARGSGNIEMTAIIGIILADVIVLVIFICFYRQELGLTVNGSNDAPILRKKHAGK